MIQKALISLDIPPYVMESATTGLEVDIMRPALANHALRFAQMPYAELQTAVQNGRAEVSVAVRQNGDETVFYSDPFITFENVAVSKKMDHLKIDGIADLGDHQALTWQEADRRIGGAARTLRCDPVKDGLRQGVDQPVWVSIACDFLVVPKRNDGKELPRSPDLPAPP